MNQHINLKGQEYGLNQRIKQKTILMDGIFSTTILYIEHIINVHKKLIRN